MNFTPDRSNCITSEFFNRPVEIVAKEILGKHVYLEGIGAMITESEAYHLHDPASHSFNGPNDKNRAMFEKPGTVYVYIFRGMWHHLNFVCQHPGSAVLIRALLADTSSIEQILLNRRVWCKGNLGPVAKYCSGPGKLGIGLGLKRDLHNFCSIDGPKFALCHGTQRLPIVRGTRINVPKNPDAVLRWAIQGCHSVSAPFENPIEDGFTADYSSTRA